MEGEKSMYKETTSTLAIPISATFHQWPRVPQRRALLHQQCVFALCTVREDAIRGLRISPRPVRRVGFRRSHIRKRVKGAIGLFKAIKPVAQVALVAAGVAMVCLGAMRGEADAVLAKAIRLCLECIGIG